MREKLEPACDSGPEKNPKKPWLCSVKHQSINNAQSVIETQWGNFS